MLVFLLNVIFLLGFILYVKYNGLCVVVYLKNDSEKGKKYNDFYEEDFMLNDYEKPLVKETKFKGFKRY